MASISHLSLLLFFTLTLSVHSKRNLDAADHRAIFTILEDLGVAGKLPRPDNPCNTAGITCELRISKEPYVLKVTGIVLKSQRLRGFLSPAIGQLSELKELSLPNNYLVDRIPPQIANCRKLEILDLRNNKLSGDVRGELKSLLHLRILDLSSNMFSGDLSFLKYFPNLEKLSLDDNMFTGKVPISLRLSPKLGFYNYNISGNRFLKGPLLALKQLDLKKTKYKRVPKRYILAELTNSSSNQGVNSPQASSRMETPNNKHRKKNRESMLIVILVAGVTSAIIFSVVFLVIVIMIKSRSNESGLVIFSPLIKEPKELALLNDDEAVASLQVIGRGGCGEVYKKEIPKGNIKSIAIKKVRHEPVAALQVIGECGEVYRKEIPKGKIKTLAIKSLEDAGELTEEHTTFENRKMRQIRSEIQTVGQIRHRNLLPLLAHVVRPTCHYLIYEFMKNGSLQDIIQQVNNGKRELDWPTRHRIAIGVASGLVYLHFDHTPRIVHRDLKPANVLLDDDMEARIADFGLAKSIPETQTHRITSNIAGTFGYIAPEYLQTMEFTEKCDVYSFGVLLAILVIGKLPSDEFFQNTSEMSMVRWMRMAMTSDNPKQAIHSNLLGNGYEEQMLLVLKIACFCTLDNPKERPNSKDCRLMLRQINL